MENLRKCNDSEIKPVPGISEEGETIYTKAPCNYFYKGFKGIYSCECISGKNKTAYSFLIQMFFKNSDKSELPSQILPSPPFVGNMGTPSHIIEEIKGTHRKKPMLYSLLLRHSGNTYVGTNHIIRYQEMLLCIACNCKNTRSLAVFSCMQILTV